MKRITLGSSFLETEFFKSQTIFKIYMTADYTETSFNISLPYKILSGFWDIRFVKHRKMGLGSFCLHWHIKWIISLFIDHRSQIAIDPLQSKYILFQTDHNLSSPHSC